MKLIHRAIERKLTNGVIQAVGFPMGTYTGAYWVKKVKES